MDVKRRSFTDFLLVFHSGAIFKEDGMCLIPGVRSHAFSKLTLASPKMAILVVSRDSNVLIRS